MLPYVTISPLHWGPLTFYPFAILISIAVLVGFTFCVIRGRRHGITREQLAEFSLWMITCGFLGARLMRFIYTPETLSAAFHDPSLLLRLQGISSFGGYGGGLIGAYLYFWVHRLSQRQRLIHLDLVGFVLPVSWMFGRIGCALVHDHPGLRATGWLTVAYPGGARYDLGVLEALFLALLAIIFFYLDRRRHSPGFFFAAYFCIYGPFRFLLDRLHVDPPRYYGIAVDQYAATIATAIGLLTLFQLRRQFENRSEKGTHALPLSIIPETQQVH